MDEKLFGWAVVALGEVPSLPRGPHMSSTHGISSSSSQISANRWREEAGRRSWARCRSPATGVAPTTAATTSPSCRWSLPRPMQLAHGPHAEIRLGAHRRLTKLELAAVLGPLRPAADLVPPWPAVKPALVRRSSGWRPRGRRWCSVRAHGDSGAHEEDLGRDGEHPAYATCGRTGSSRADREEWEKNEVFSS
jgi:hypothetical protein